MKDFSFGEQDFNNPEKPIKKVFLIDEIDFLLYDSTAKWVNQFKKKLDSINKDPKDPVLIITGVTASAWVTKNEKNYVENFLHFKVLATHGAVKDEIEVEYLPSYSGLVCA